MKSPYNNKQVWLISRNKQGRKGNRDWMLEHSMGLMKREAEIRDLTVVYFDQLLGACSTQKLVEIRNT